MAPRIALTSSGPGPLGMPDTSGRCPELTAARRTAMIELGKLDGVDPVTLEVVRLQNARHKHCHL